jgi:hypothetical protein
MTCSIACASTVLKLQVLCADDLAKISNPLGVLARSQYLDATPETGGVCTRAWKTPVVRDPICGEVSTFLALSCTLCTLWATGRAEQRCASEWLRLVLSRCKTNIDMAGTHRNRYASRMHGEQSCSRMRSLDECVISMGDDQRKVACRALYRSEDELLELRLSRAAGRGICCVTSSPALVAALEMSHMHAERIAGVTVHREGIPKVTASYPFPVWWVNRSHLTSYPSPPCGESLRFPIKSANGCRPFRAPEHAWPVSVGIAMECRKKRHMPTGNCARQDGVKTWTFGRSNPHPMICLCRFLEYARSHFWS